MAVPILWRGQRDLTRRGSLLRWIAASALLHLPLSPIGGLFGLLAMLEAPEAAPPYDPNQVTAVPVDVVGPELMPLERDQSSRPTAPAPERAAPAPEQQPRPETLVVHREQETSASTPDAGLEDAGLSQDARSDSADGTEEAAREPLDAASPEPDQEAGSGPRLTNPIALAGAAGRIADAQAPVSIAIYMQNIRRHPLGAEVARILGRVYQWRDFFGPARLNPVEDIDRMLIAGPEFDDSSRIVAVLRYNVSQERIRAAIDGIVRSSPGGRWLGGKVPLAMATADRAPRLFLIPVSGLLVVGPLSAKQSLLALPGQLARQSEPFPPPRGNEVMVAHLVAPWAAFARARLPIKVPKSIRSATVALVPTPEGGLRAEIEAPDESAESATEHADQLLRAVTAATRVGGRLFRFSLVESVRFWAEGELIRGEMVARAEQVALALAFVTPMVTPPDAWPVGSVGTGPEATSGSAAPGSGLIRPVESSPASSAGSRSSPVGSSADSPPLPGSAWGISSARERVP